MSVESQMKIAVILSAYDKMTAVVNSSVANAEKKLKKVQKGLNEFADKALIGGGVGTLFFGKTIEAAEESAQAQNRLRQVFKSMGQDYENATKQSVEYASALQVQIGREDETILAVQAKLATFQKAANATARTNGIFQRATEAAFDLEAAGFGEASGNAVQLGKALQDPVKGIMALRRAGITFTDAEQKKIKALVHSGKLFEAQNTVMKAIEKQVGGVAKSSATTSSKMKIAWSEVMETIGGKVLPLFERFAAWFTGTAIPKIQAFIEQHPKLVKWLAIGSVALLGLGAAAKVVAFGINGVTSAIKAVKTVFNVLSVVTKFFIANPILLVVVAIAVAAYLIIRNWNKIKAFFINLWEGIKMIFSTVWNFIKNLFLNYTPYGLVIKHWSTIQAFFVGIWERVKSVFSNAWKWIKNLFLNFTPVGLIFKHWGKVKGFFGGVWNGAKNIFRGSIQSIKSYLFNFTPLAIIKHWSAIKNFFVNLWQGVKNVFWSVVNWIKGLGKQMWEAGKNLIMSIWRGIKSVITAPVDAVKNMVKKIRRFLPFSPAKEGPLQDIHKIRLVETIAESIRPASLFNKMRQVAKIALNAVAKPNRTIQAQSATQGNGANFYVTINLHGSATKEDGANITAEIKKQFKQYMKQYKEQQARVSFG